MNKQVWKHAQRPLAAALLAGLMASALSGCFGILLGAGVMGGAAAIDRRSLGAQTDDQAIVIKGEARVPSPATMATSTSRASTARSC